MHYALMHQHALNYIYLRALDRRFAAVKRSNQKYMWEFISLIKSRPYSLTVYLWIGSTIGFSHPQFQTRFLASPSRAPIPILIPGIHTPGRFPRFTFTSRAPILISGIFTPGRHTSSLPGLPYSFPGFSHLVNTLPHFPGSHTHFRYLLAAKPKAYQLPIYGHKKISHWSHCSHCIIYHTRYNIHTLLHVNIPTAFFSKLCQRTQSQPGTVNKILCVPYHILRPQCHYHYNTCQLLVLISRKRAISRNTWKKI